MVKTQQTIDIIARVKDIFADGSDVKLVISNQYSAIKIKTPSGARIKIQRANLPKTHLRTPSLLSVNMCYKKASLVTYIAEDQLFMTDTVRNSLKKFIITSLALQP